MCGDEIVENGWKKVRIQRYQLTATFSKNSGDRETISTVSLALTILSLFLNFVICPGD